MEKVKVRGYKWCTWKRGAVIEWEKEGKKREKESRGIDNEALRRERRNNRKRQATKSARNTAHESLSCTVRYTPDSAILAISSGSEAFLSMERSSAMPHRHSTEVMLKLRMTCVTVRIWRCGSVGGGREGGRRYVRREAACLEEQPFRYDWKVGDVSKTKDWISEKGQKKCRDEILRDARVKE